MVENEPSTRVVITSEQRRQFEEDGFFLVHNALSQDAIADLKNSIEVLARQHRERSQEAPNAPLRMGNIVALDHRFLQLVDHPQTLPLVLDVLGYNIQLRASQLDYRPPRQQTESRLDRFLEWHVDAPSSGWPLTHGIQPFMEVKVGFYLTDLLSPDCGALLLVRGSHREAADWCDARNRVLDQNRVVEIRVEAGTAIVWPHGTAAPCFVELFSECAPSACITRIITVGFGLLITTFNRRHFWAAVTPFNGNYWAIWDMGYPPP